MLIGRIREAKKNIDKSVKNMQKASKLIFWPKLHIYSKITEMNNLILYFWVYVIEIRAKKAFFCSNINHIYPKIQN